MRNRKTHPAEPYLLTKGMRDGRNFPSCWISIEVVISTGEGGVAVITLPESNAKLHIADQRIEDPAPIGRDRHATSEILVLSKNWPYLLRCEIKKRVQWPLRRRRDNDRLPFCQVRRI